MIGRCETGTTRTPLRMCECCCTELDDHVVTVQETLNQYFYCSQGCALAAGHWEHDTDGNGNDTKGPDK